MISALRDLYGRNGAETISGLCGTRLVLAAPDRDTAQWSAESLGRTEVEEMAEGFSYGANTIRDGVSLTPRRELRALALASEIMRLESLTGYLRFPGPLPVAKIALPWVDRPAVAERFVPRAADAPPQEPPADAEAGTPVAWKDPLLSPPSGGEVGPEPMPERPAESGKGAPATETPPPATETEVESLPVAAPPAPADTGQNAGNGSRQGLHADEAPEAGAPAPRSDPEETSGQAEGGPPVRPASDWL